MVEPKELRRVMEIVRAHARTALTKDSTQRESFLRYCRNNWKRYAAGMSRRTSEGDRFAAVLDSATRDLLALAEAAPDAQAAAEILRGEPPPNWEDTIEGAMDSVIMYEAYQESEYVSEPIATAKSENGAAPETESIPSRSAPLAAAPIEIAETPAHAEQRSAEEEDRLGARYGFRSPAEADPATPAVEPPEHAQELQRKVRAVLMAHRPKSSD
jgi:hypothetical protein